MMESAGFGSYGTSVVQGSTYFEFSWSTTSTSLDTFFSDGTYEAALIASENSSANITTSHFVFLTFTDTVTGDGDGDGSANYLIYDTTTATNGVWVMAELSNVTAAEIDQSAITGA